MVSFLFSKKAKLDTPTQIKKTLEKEIKRRDKLQGLVDSLKSRLDEKGNWYKEVYAVKIRLFGIVGCFKDL
ncbi:hypothetical protein PP175_26845 (plasmid) [Aneurinibacillus sp. Ricciae_BoGa-3]|uniref:hypothetical protein n=1 Tax=Aneurinibacillus sp. Ricciae_BoGa-3 TaxID=3022697 RepID=UPI0023413463|nr:hypothetical protein [Aneurinibacillus sp. Ricciae_BoGa-3]WCK57656.1 hypothetical protein PP175_26845 [Aneurinibacillus sp. Ricciae_BoGa-3]